MECPQLHPSSIALPSPLPRGEVAFSSRSGACLCGRPPPPRCGAAVSAADAAVCLPHSSGCRWGCAKAPRNTQRHPPGTQRRNLHNKSPGDSYQRRRFHLKRKNRSCAVRLVAGLTSRDAGGATRPGPFTSVLKERGGKENLRSGLLNALDKKEKEEGKKRRKHRSVNSVQAISRDIYKPPQV